MIFIVEDDDDIARLLQHQVSAAGFNVERFAAGDVALRRAPTNPPDLFLLDVMLPGENGLDLCRRIRSHPALTASRVIFLSCRASEQDRIAGLEAGADDYITKPFSPRELIARVRAAMRRGTLPSPELLRFGNIEIDTSAMLLRVGGLEKKTTAAEFRILEVLARSPERVFTRNQLLEVIGESGRDVNPRTIDVYVSRLRDKIEPDPDHPERLCTVRGVGYRFSTRADAV